MSLLELVKEALDLVPDTGTIQRNEWHSRAAKAVAAADSARSTVDGRSRGPWRVYPAGCEIPNYQICPRVVADVPNGRGIDTPISDADANLIAAAPDLFEALKNLEAACHQNSKERLDATTRAARVALAKALGLKDEPAWGGK